MKQDSVFLNHILDEINFITRALSDKNYDSFLADDTLKRAVSRSIEIIGEAIKNISETTRNKHPELEWKKIAGMRDKIIHDYFDVNWDIVWNAAKEKLPALKENISAILRDTGK